MKLTEHLEEIFQMGGEAMDAMKSGQRENISTFDQLHV